MKRLVEALGNDAVLHSHIPRERDRERLIHSPRGRNVIENHAVRVPNVDAVRTTGIEILRAFALAHLDPGERLLDRTRIEIPRAHANITNDYVMRLVDIQRVTPNRNSPRRGLPRNRELVLANLKRSVKPNSAANVKQNRPRRLSR